MDAGGRATQEQLPRRKKGRIASYATLFTTKKMDKKTSKLGIFFAGNRLNKLQDTCVRIWLKITSRFVYTLVEANSFALGD